MIEHNGPSFEHFHRVALKGNDVVAPSETNK